MDLASEEELDRFAKEHYKKTCVDPYEWLSAAKTLRAGAEELYVRINTLCPDFFECNSLAEETQETYLAIHGLAVSFRLISAYSVENALKGLAIALGRVNVLLPDEEGVTKDILTHNLLRLAEKCKLPLSMKDQTLLNHLQKEIRWAKYPFPAHYQETITTRKVTKQINLLDNPSPRDFKKFYSGDQDISADIWRLWDKIIEAYP